MSEYVHLIGAEDVRSAGATIASAAERMAQVQGWHSDDLVRHREFMNDWLARFEQVLKDHLPTQST